MSFFIQNIGGCASYTNIRDLSKSSAVEARTFINKLWNSYKDYADKNFKSDAVNHFQQRFWEMYLGVTLIKNGFKIYKDKEKGPEFYAKARKYKIWFEAIAPSRGTGRDAAPKEMLNQPNAVKVQEDKIILRIRHAIHEKNKKYLEYVSSNTISSYDPYVIAINSKRIQFQIIEPAIPFIIKSVFPFGDSMVEWDVASSKPVREFYSYRDKIAKENNSLVSTSIFLDQKHSVISAIIFSSVDPANYPENFGDDFKIVYNPNAINPIPDKIFNFGTQYQLEGETLKSK